MRISDWSSDVCSSDLEEHRADREQRLRVALAAAELARDDDEHPAEAEQRGGDRAPPDPLAEEDGGHVEREQWRDEGERDRLCHRSEEHTSELQSLMRISYAVFCLKKKI